MKLFYTDKEVYKEYGKIERDLCIEESFPLERMNPISGENHIDQSQKRYVFLYERTCISIENEPRYLFILQGFKEKVFEMFGIKKSY